MDEKSILKQVKRLGVFDYFPSGNSQDDKIRRGEFVRTMYNACEHDEHVRRVIDKALTLRWGKSGRESPTTAELLELANEVPSTAERKVGCEACSQTGYIVSEDQSGYSWAKRCTCWGKPA